MDVAAAAAVVSCGVDIEVATGREVGAKRQSEQPLLVRDRADPGIDVHENRVLCRSVATLQLPDDSVLEHDEDALDVTRCCRDESRAAGPCGHAAGHRDARQVGVWNRRHARADVLICGVGARRKRGDER